MPGDKFPQCHVKNVVWGEDGGKALLKNRSMAYLSYVWWRLFRGPIRTWPCG